MRLCPLLQGLRSLQSCVNLVRVKQTFSFFLFANILQILTLFPNQNQHDSYCGKQYHIFLKFSYIALAPGLQNLPSLKSIYKLQW